MELFSHCKNHPAGSLDHTHSLTYSVIQALIYLVEFSMLFSIYKVIFLAREVAEVDPLFIPLTIGLVFFLHIESNQPNSHLASERLSQAGKCAFPGYINPHRASLY